MAENSKWKDRMVKKYGSEEAVREEMQRRYELSRKNGPVRTGGYNYLKRNDPAKLSELQREFAQRRWNVKKDSK